MAPGPGSELGESWVVLGLISAPYGVRGWVRVKSYTQDPEGLAQYATWWVEAQGQWRPVRIEEYRLHGRGSIAKLEGCADRTSAETYAGCRVAVPRSALPEPGDGEFYWIDLIGLRVENLEGVQLGEVSAILETGAHPVLQVAAERERLIPLVDPIVRDVDLERRVVRVDWGPDY
ncbi:ribosome maturation factor RimM [Pelomicrobium sp. G1]|uniref:ribosome maturation factor RimM n=1 Tax=unclassified Pelomicrobium TaxID=2815318 RepID=UPI003F76BC0E